MSLSISFSLSVLGAHKASFRPLYLSESYVPISSPALTLERIPAASRRPCILLASVLSGAWVPPEVKSYPAFLISFMMRPRASGFFSSSSTQLSSTLLYVYVRPPANVTINSFAESSHVIFSTARESPVFN